MTDRSLATVLFTDIVGSTQRAGQLGDRAWQELLARHHECVRRELRRHGGREVATAGDGFLAVFEQPAPAIRCACADRGAHRPACLGARTCGRGTRVQYGLRENSRFERLAAGS
jgi:class 3 adenylate cyclase